MAAKHSSLINTFDDPRNVVYMVIFAFTAFISLIIYIHHFFGRLSRNQRLYFEQQPLIHRRPRAPDLEAAQLSLRSEQGGLPRPFDTFWKGDKLVVVFAQVGMVSL